MGPRASKNAFTMIRRKTVGWGSLGALEKARRARADTWERVRRAVEDRTMGRREAEEERQRAATLVQQAWSGGYKRACEVGGAIFVPMALTPYGGWHREDKDSAESWTRRTTHTGDNVGYYEFDQRFEHPGRTWASATHLDKQHSCPPSPALQHTRYECKGTNNLSVSDLIAECSEGLES